MAADTSIEWATHTFNPWRGCTKVSAGCKHCYAEHAAPVRIARSKGIETWGTGAAREIASESMWKQPLLWDRKAKEAGERHRVFCASLADVFEDYHGPSADAVNAARLRLWALIEATPNLDWLLLTKRPQNVMAMISDSWRAGMPQNVWMGCTVENQEAAEDRMLWLFKIPAKVRFVSQEPQVGPVDWNRIEVGRKAESLACVYYDALSAGKLHWIIVGGESGHNARPFDLAWARQTVAQCKAAGVPVFVKQLGAKPWLNGQPYWIVSKKGSSMSEIPPDLKIREVPQ